jgi:hypothetical protein
MLRGFSVEKIYSLTRPGMRRTYVRNLNLSSSSCMWFWKYVDLSLKKRREAEEKLSVVDVFGC